MPIVGLEAGDVDARMVRERARGGDALSERREPARVLERIARRHQPPDAVEPEPLHGDQAGGAMGVVRRIERAAEQADAHAGRMGREAHHGHEGFYPSDRAGAPRRVCPLPKGEGSSVSGVR